MRNIFYVTKDSIKHKIANFNNDGSKYELILPYSKIFMLIKNKDERERICSDISGASFILISAFFCLCLFMLNFNIIVSLYASLIMMLIIFLSMKMFIVYIIVNNYLSSEIRKIVIKSSIKK